MALFVDLNTVHTSFLLLYIILDWVAIYITVCISHNLHKPIGTTMLNKMSQMKAATWDLSEIWCGLECDITHNRQRLINILFYMLNMSEAQFNWLSSPRGENQWSKCQDCLCVCLPEVQTWCSCYTLLYLFKQRRLIYNAALAGRSCSCWLLIGPESLEQRSTN